MADNVGRGVGKLTGQGGHVDFTCFYEPALLDEVLQVVLISEVFVVLPRRLIDRSINLSIELKNMP